MWEVDFHKIKSRGTLLDSRYCAGHVLGIPPKIIKYNTEIIIVSLYLQEAQAQIGLENDYDTMC
jgi:hypothetical protein